MDKVSLQGSWRPILRIGPAQPRSDEQAFIQPEALRELQERELGRGDANRLRDLNERSGRYL